MRFGCCGSGRGFSKKLITLFNSDSTVFLARRYRHISVPLKIATTNPRARQVGPLMRTEVSSTWLVEAEGRRTESVVTMRPTPRQTKMTPPENMQAAVLNLELPIGWYIDEMTELVRFIAQEISSDRFIFYSCAECTRVACSNG